MEKCKFCQAELEEEVTVCPSCGKDNAEAEETATVEETVAEETVAPESEESAGETVAEEVPAPEAKPVKKSSPALVAALIVLILALVAAMAALVIGGMKGDFMKKAPRPDAVVVGNKDAASPLCKGTYTEEDKKVLRKVDTVVAKAGDLELTMGELQIAYWQEVQGFLSQYGAYASYFGLDVTQPLESQMCGVVDGMSWQQFFLERAINSWHAYNALAAEAEVKGFQLPQEYVDYLDQLPQQLELQATTGGYGDAQSLLAYNTGAGTTVELYVDFLRVYYMGAMFQEDFYLNAGATAEEIEAMFAAHEAEYAQIGLTKETKNVNVRHILIYPEGATSETIRTETFPEEAWAAGKATAEGILEQWLAGEKTEESFAALAGEYTQDPGSAYTGGLYTDVTEGQMVQNFNDWCFDPARQVGDYGIVETEFGYHIMFYSGETLQWMIRAEEDVIGEKTNAMAEDAMAKFPLTVYYDRILLSEAPFYSGNFSIQ